jgi:porphobilinogen synthase
MGFPIRRMRRLRRNEGIRSMVRETSLSAKDFIYPLFIVEGSGIKKEIKSLPGNYHFSVDRLPGEAADVLEKGIPAVLLFGIPKEKDEFASAAFKENGLVQNAIKVVKENVPELVVITDLCLCAYTNHGLCGILKNSYIDNDETLKVIKKAAVSHANAGADMIAPSGMMDGAVKTIRSALDENNFSNTLILSYAAKYASSFYGPFRDAVSSGGANVDKRTNQMDFANTDEALREIALDIEEGADIVMVKPALAYLDIVHRVKNEFRMPVAAYNVSGEYSMIKAAAQKGLIDENKIVIEILSCIKRAGADLILTYFAKQVVDYLSDKK